MKYFFDTEFMEDGPTTPIELISIGLVAEDGRELYCVNSEADLTRANEWVKLQVIPQLPDRSNSAWMTREQIRTSLVAFAPPGTKPEFWAYFASYDWVVFSQIFGRMVDLPPGYPMWVRDLKQRASDLFVPREIFPAHSKGEHDALEDARWNRELYAFLEDVRTKRDPVAAVQKQIEIEREKARGLTTPAARYAMLVLDRISERLR